MIQPPSGSPPWATGSSVMLAITTIMLAIHHHHQFKENSRTTEGMGRAISQF
jgi:hypothetical protein